MEHGEDSLRTLIEAMAPLREDDWQRLRALLELQSFAAGAHLQRAGEGCVGIFFLRAGLVREYYTRVDGTERTRSFAGRSNITAAYADFVLKQPAQVSIQALEATEAWLLPFGSLETLRRASASLELIGRRLLEQMYVQKEKREFQFLTMTPTERYQRLAEDFPAIEQSVPQYLVASYLGITPVALSRIRRRARSKP